MGNKGSLKRYLLLLWILRGLLFTGWQGYLYIRNNDTSSASPGAIGPPHTLEIAERKFPRRPPVQYERPDFEAGIVFPQWTPDGYGVEWQRQLPTY